MHISSDTLILTHSLKGAIKHTNSTINPVHVMLLNFEHCRKSIHYLQNFPFSWKFPSFPHHDFRGLGLLLLQRQRQIHQSNLEIIVEINIQLNSAQHLITKDMKVYLLVVR